MQAGSLVRAARAGLPKRMVFFHKTGLTDAWRKHPIVNRSENVKMKHMFPGLKTAIGLFAVYVAVRLLHHFLLMIPSHAWQSLR